MAKKVKRKVSQVRIPELSSEQNSPQNVDVPTPSTRSTFSRRSVITTNSEFNPDYTYVVNDLKRIGILAGSFFVILIVLSFFIR